MNPQNLRILYIIDGLRGGGKERQLVEVLKELSKNSYIILGVITFNKNKHYSESVRKIVPFFVELSKRPTRLEPVFTIWKQIKKFKPDVIHTWDSLSSMYTWLPSKFLKIKFIDGSIRDAGIEKGWQKFLKRLFLKKADLVLANSMAGLMTYNIDGKVIYNAIDDNRFAKECANSEFNLIMTANFTDYKDHQTFLKAAVNLVTEKTVDKVFLPGDGPYKSKYEEWIKTKYPLISDQFRFLGAVNNVEEFLAKCKVGVLCSTTRYGEGVSNSVLEYMASGLVPIATDIGGTSEIIENGQNGFLIKPKDSDKIVEIVKMIKTDIKLFEKITKNARATIAAKFSYDKNINELLEIYSKLCTKN